MRAQRAAVPTDAGRFRDRAIVRTFLAGGAFQLSFLLSALVSLPVLTRALSQQEFGVVATLTSLPALLAFTDLGIGGALTTRLPLLRAKGESVRAQQSVSTAWVASLAVGAGITSIGLLLAQVVPWSDLFGTSELPEGDLRWAVTAAAVCTGLAVPGALGQRVLYGLHRGDSANGWMIVATVVSAALSMVSAALGAPLWMIVSSMLGVPALVGLLSLAWVVARQERDLRPTWAGASAREWQHLRGASWWFFVIAATSAVGYQSDVFIVAASLGAEQAGVYGVCVRAFGLLLQLLAPALNQLWPAFSDAWARHDVGWVRRRLVWASVGGGALSAAGGLVLVVAGPTLISTWLTPDLAPDRSLLLACAAWTTYSLVSAPFFVLMNATGYVRDHALAATGVAVVNVGLSIWWVHLIGLPGPAWASLAATVIVSAPVGVVVTRRVLCRPERDAQVHSAT